MPDVFSYLAKSDTGVSIYKNKHTYFITDASEMKILIPLEDSFQMPGTYVFVPEDIEEPVEFLNHFRSLSSLHENKLLFLWIENPDAVWDIWNYHAITGTKKQGEGTVTRSVGFQFSRYSFLIKPGLSIALAENGFLFQDQQGNQPIVFRTGNLLFQPLNRSFFITHDGQMQFQAAAAPEQKNMFYKMDAGIKYSILLPLELKNEQQAYECGYTGCLYNTVMDWKDGIQLECLIDFSSPQNYARTYFKLPAKQRKESNFSTVGGKNVGLRTTGHSKLVFETCPVYSYTKLSDSKRARELKNQYYLGLAGEFELELPESADQTLLCGLSGMEYAGIPEDNTTIGFLPGNKAYLDTAGEETILTDKGTASWITIPNQSYYYSQPGTMPFFAMNEWGSLSLLSLPILSINSMTPAVPMMLYRNIHINSPDNIDFKDIEKNIYEERYAELRKTMPFRSMRSAEITAVTPQGLLVGIGRSGEVSAAWNWLAVGNQLRYQVNLEETYMRLLSISHGLRTEFQKDSFHILFDGSKELSSQVGGTQNLLASFFGLDFSFDPDHWRAKETYSDTYTVMIMKYNEKESIAEAYGSHPIVKNAIDKCFDEKQDLKEDYLNFYQTVHDKYFQGILILNCNMQVDETSGEFISELRFVLNSIEDKDELYAHHIIIDNNKAKNGNGNIYLERSSISLLVDYKSDKKLTFSRDEESKEFDFLTTEFMLAVRDSEVKKIKTTSELLINSLYMTPADKFSEGGNCLIIDGTLKKNNGMSVFEYALRKEELYQISSVLEEVEITGVSLACGEDNTGIFSLSGMLYFMKEGKGDLFGYGLSGEDRTYGLLFSSLKIFMPDHGAMYMTYGDVVLLPDLSKPRPESMSANFPLALEGLFYESQSNLPEDAGYTAITAPVSQSKISNPWFGLIYRIPLGSLGDLSESSSFDLYMMVAWGEKETEEGQGVYIGVKLPAALGGGGIDLQGILKLGFHSIQLLSEEVQMGEITSRRYLLRLHEFALKFLGISFPPGTSDIYIFADEKGEKLGWYAAYKGE